MNAALPALLVALTVAVFLAPLVAILHNLLRSYDNNPLLEERRRRQTDGSLSALEQALSSKLAYRMGLALLYLIICGTIAVFAASAYSMLIN